MIPDLKRRGAVVILTLTSIPAGAHAACGQDQARLSSIQGTLGPVNLQFQAASQPPRPFYETREIHDPNGTGKFYMDREIAQAMGPGGIPWLDRPERKAQEKPSLVLDALHFRGNEVV